MHTIEYFISVKFQTVTFLIIIFNLALVGNKL